MQSHLDSVDSFQSAAPLVPTEARSEELVRAFARHIKEARGMGVSALDYNPLLNFKVMAITVPEHWDVSARTMVAKAAQLAGQPLESSSMILKLPQAVTSTYRIGKDTTGRCLTVLVLYHKTHLHLMLVQMSKDGFVVEGQVYLAHLGEDAILRSSVASSAAGPGNKNLKKNSNGRSSSREELYPLTETSLTEDDANDGPTPETLASKDSASKEPFPEAPCPEELIPEPSTSAHPAHDDTEPPKYRGDLRPIQEALRKFLIFMTLSRTPDLLKELPEILKYAVSDVGCIVVDGEANPRGKMALCAAIQEMFADMDWLSVKGNIHDCGAYGASVAAQMQLQNPKHLGNWRELPGYLPENDV